MTTCTALDWILKNAKVTEKTFIEEAGKDMIERFFHNSLPTGMLNKISKFFNVRSICNVGKPAIYKGHRFYFSNENTAKGGKNVYRISIDNEPELLELAGMVSEYDHLTA